MLPVKKIRLHLHYSKYTVYLLELKMDSSSWSKKFPLCPPSSCNFYLSINLFSKHLTKPVKTYTFIYFTCNIQCMYNFKSIHTFLRRMLIKIVQCSELIWFCLSKLQVISCNTLPIHFQHFINFVNVILTFVNILYLIPMTRFCP